MAKKNNALAWGIGLGTIAAAGLGIYLYEKSQTSSASTASNTTAASKAPATPSSAAPNIGETVQAYNTRMAAIGNPGAPTAINGQSTLSKTWNGSTWV